MKSIKAIFAGSIFIIVAILLLQLIYIFVAVAYNALAKDYPFLNDIAFTFRYTVGIPVFIATMFIGGYITARISHHHSQKLNLIKTVSNCLTVGLITTIAMIYPTLENSSITITGMVIFSLALIATTTGGIYWQRNQVKDSFTSD